MTRVCWGCLRKAATSSRSRMCAFYIRDIDALLQGAWVRWYGTFSQGCRRDTMGSGNRQERAFPQERCPLRDYYSNGYSRLTGRFPTMHP